MIKCRLSADEEIELVPGGDAGARDVPLDERRAMFRLGIDARVGELPVGGAGLVVFGFDEVGFGFESWRQCERPRPDQALQ